MKFKEHGAQARLEGCAVNNPPALLTHAQHVDWITGWWEQDMKLQADAAEKERVKQASIKLQHGSQFGKPPFSYCKMGQQIYDSNGLLVLDVRGWGALTGQGCACAVSEDQAMQIQDAFGTKVVQVLNDHFPRG